MKPSTLPDEQQTILSFLPPSIEEEMGNAHAGVTVSARVQSREVRGAARELYIDLVARIGLVHVPSGDTFRRSICPPGEASPWWYHRVAFKDSERDPTFEWIIAVLTIRKFADKHSLRRLVLVGAPQQITETLKTEFSIEEIQTCSRKSLTAICLRGIAGRVKYAVNALRQLKAVRREFIPPQKAFDVALCSFWDWSVSLNEHSKDLTDRYFKRLPNELTAQGASVGWVAWFDPDAEPERRGRPLAQVLERVKDRDDVVILQSFVSPRDILRAVIKFDPLRAFLKMRRQASFREALTESKLDYGAIFIEPLLLGFADASLPHQSLVALATERCFRHYAPRVAFSFLEHFPHARAQYEGMRRAASRTVSFISQHATYSHEKTFLFMHPAVEFRGEPDGVASPHADYVCAMGSWGQKLFLECGYARQSVLLTGSPRYDHVTAPSPEQPIETFPDGTSIRVLLVCSLDTTLELEMVDAVCAAARDIPGVRLSLRNHPFRRIEQDPAFVRYRDQIELTGKSLDEDLAQCELVLFTYSTVAEEALLKGKPVWQWLPLRANGSALAEVIEIPQFGSVADLRQSLREFQRDPGRFAPTFAARTVALEKVFYKGDGGAAHRLSVLGVEQLSMSASPR